MDTDVSRWVLEFLLRSSVPDSLISKTLTALPISGADSRLKKTLLLRTLQSLHSKASITETALEILELVEELDRNDAVPITDSMRRAYRAVAVECTVKYLASRPDDAAGHYFAAVRRIWRGRVAEMENRGPRSGLFSGELAQWRDDVEAALWDPRVCERLAGLNSRTEALNEVKVYLKEAWEIMGPSFLDSVAAMAKAKGLRLDGVCEFGFGSEPARKRDGSLEVSKKEGRDFVGGDRNELDDGDDNDGACCMDDENEGKEEKLEERVGASVDGNQELPAEGEKEIQEGNPQLKCKPSALRRCPDSINKLAFGGEPMRKRDKGLEGLAKERRDSVRGDRSEPDDDGVGVCCMEDEPVTGENQGKEHVEERVGTSVDENQELGGCDLPAQGEKEIQKGNLQLKLKHSALRRCHRGVKISSTEEVEPAKLRSLCDLVSSPKVNEVRESLKSSSLELRALVKDPLPDALQTSEVVRSKLGPKDINDGLHTENQSGDLDVPDPDVGKSIVLYQPNDANLVKKSPVHCRNVHRPNLMERKSTACTYEWDDSTDSLPQGKQPRRKKRKWTSLEEDTLRAGVKMFGEGNWAMIRSFYSNIFENRSGVDLKDKWRNMIR